MLAIDCVRRVIDEQACRLEIDRGCECASSKVYGRKCRFVKALLEGKYDEASNFSRVLIKEELKTKRHLKHSVLRDMLEDQCDTESICLSYDQTERLISGCLEEIFEKSRQSIKTLHQTSKLKFLSNNSIPQILNFLANSAVRLSSDLSISSLSVNDVYCMDVLVYYDFIHIIKLTYTGTLDTLSAITYSELHGRVLTHIPYQFIFVKKCRDGVKTHPPGIKYYRLCPSWRLMRAHQIIQPSNTVNTRHVLVSRVVPEIADFDRHESDMLYFSSRPYYMSMPDAVRHDGRRVSRHAVITSDTGYGFKPVADALKSLLREAVDSHIDNRVYEQAFNDVNMKSDHRELDLKADLEPEILDFDEELLKLVKNKEEYIAIIRHTPEILIINVYCLAHKSIFTDKIALNHGKLTYRLAHKRFSIYEDSNICSSFRIDAKAKLDNKPSSRTNCTVHYYSKTSA